MAIETIEIKLGDVKGQVTNDTPAPSSKVVDRNSDFRAWLPAGKPWHVEVRIGADTVLVSSGIATVKAGKKFCLQVCTRVTDNSDEPVVVVEEKVL